jgi:precorrin-8X/cobalt-precorrin-8 methylmutase
MKPDEIEKLSFQIIEQEIGAHNLANQQWLIVRRMIHTSADFEYKKMVRFHPDAIKAGLDAIRSGKKIITDTNMARVGIRKKELDQFGASTACFMNDPAVHRQAKASSITRAKVAVDMAVEDMKGGIYVVGNAPTALMRLVELVKEQKARPALIIGLPVGFVNAAESKAALMDLDYPFISNVGRKGGSTVAASVVNALAIMASEIQNLKSNIDVI